MVIDVTNKLNDGWLGVEPRASPPGVRSWGLAVARPQPPVFVLVFCAINGCLSIADGCFAFLHELVERDWIVRVPHRG